MNFAFWRKCDFQVHTPRDPKLDRCAPGGIGETIEATGAAATAQDVDAARELWAKEFVDQCIAKSLQAVALTDHHEMIMVPYVQKEVEVRRKADPEFDLWLFSGMELTASGGKQCLIIFDADLSEEWRIQAQAGLELFMPISTRKTPSRQRSHSLPATIPTSRSRLTNWMACAGSISFCRMSPRAIAIQY